VASLREELKLQKGIVSALLTRIYGAKSEKMSLDQLLMTFLEDEAKKTEAVDGQNDPPAADPSQKKAPKKNAHRTNRLIESLEGLPSRGTPPPVPNFPA